MSLCAYPLSLHSSCLAQLTPGSSHSHCRPSSHSTCTALLYSRLVPPLPAAAAAAAADENGKNKSSKKKKKKAHPTTRNEELPVGAWLPPTQQALALVNTQAQAHMHSSLRRSSSLRITQTPQSQLLFGAATGAGAGAVAGAACTSSSSAQSQSQAANANVAGVYYPSTYRDRFVADDKLTPERGDREREKPPSRWTQVRRINS